jgi:hypothetical protein
MMADAILVLHLTIVIFIVAGLPLIYLGAALHWGWVRGWRWRAAHVGAIAFVAAEAIAGVACPLTIWEDALRGHESGAGFIERWVHRLLFYDAPPWVFTVAYVVFALLIVATWFVVRPTRRQTR